MLGVLVPPADSFNFCIPTNHEAAWQAYFRDLGPDERLTLREVSQGIKPDFVYPQCQPQQAQPKDNQLTTDMLRQLHGVRHGSR